MAPKFWMAVTSLTMTFFFDISIAPLARLAETIVASISGIRPIASVRAKVTASMTSSHWRPEGSRYARTIMMMNTGGTIRYISLSRTFTMDLLPLSYVVGAFFLVSFSAMEPNIVSSPTATTIASAEPPTTLVPMNAMLLQPRISSQLTASACLVTPPDSPVRAD